MHKRTKALSISKAVKEAVYARDSGICVVCGKSGDPVAHYISRAQGGLGIEQNIVTLCPSCHRIYDQSPKREILRSVIRNYLKNHYQNWDERKLIYRKYGG